MTTDRMSPKAYRATASLASIYAFRMLGLFMVLPIFVPYAHQLTGSTPVLIGLAIGIYGLSQALLQIPFGMLSDRFGRKRIISIGLILFAIGSVVAALATSIEGMIIGRLLQGTGAIGSTLTALLADLTPEEHRTKAMAMIGMTIGLSFFVAMFLGPLLNTWIGVSGIFWLTTILALIGIVFNYSIVPTPEKLQFHRDTETIPAKMRLILSNSQLLRLDFGIFAAHAILMGCFIALPMIFLQRAGLPSDKQWQVYLPVLILAFIAMFPCIMIAEKKRCMKQAFCLAILVLGLSQLGIWFFDHSIIGIAVCLFLFFTVFSFLEASLPSLVSKIAPPEYKGTAIGVYASAQFLGIFFGGAIGGWIYKLGHVNDILLYAALLALIWLLIAISMKQPPYVSSKMVKIKPLNTATAKNLSDQLLQVPGVHTAAVIPGEDVVYLKIDKQQLDTKKLSHTFAHYTIVT